MIQLAEFDIAAHTVYDSEMKQHRFVKETERELLRLSKLLGGEHSRGRLAYQWVLAITDAIPQIKRDDLLRATQCQQSLRQVCTQYVAEIPLTFDRFLSLSTEDYNHGTFLLRMMFTRPSDVEVSHLGRSHHI